MENSLYGGKKPLPEEPGRFHAWSPTQSVIDQRFQEYADASGASLAVLPDFHSWVTA
jgi:hypothetical protein